MEVSIPVVVVITKGKAMVVVAENEEKGLRHRKPSLLYQANVIRLYLKVEFAPGTDGRYKVVITVKLHKVRNQRAKK